MIAGQIGKGRGGDRQAVEPELGEPMARRLDRDMLDALAGRERPDRGGAPPGRASSAHPAAGRDAVTNPSVPRLAASVAGCRPDLAGEMGDRGLAVGAGDGGDRARLPAIKSRRQQRQPAPRVGVGDDRDARACFRREDRARPRRRSGSPPRRAPPRRRQIDRPSSCRPGRAANKKPGRTARESAVMPTMSGSPGE